MKSKKKKTIARHILGLIGVGTLWFILNQVLDMWFGITPFYEGREYFGENLDKGYLEFVDNWGTDILSDGGLLLLGMLIVYVGINYKNIQ